MTRSARLRRALAAVWPLEGDAGAAVAAALAATRKSKTGSPDREAARATCVAVFDAFGQKHPDSVAGRGNSPTCGSCVRERGERSATRGSF